MNAIQILPNTMTAALVQSATVAKLTGSEMEIVRATNERRIMDMDETEVKFLAVDIIFKAKGRLGYNPTQTEEECDAEILMISDDLKGFKGLTGREVHLALKSGINGDFSTDGRVFWSSASFVQWVRRWVNEKKLEVMKKYTALEASKTVEKPAMTEEQHKALSYEIANEYVKQMQKSHLQKEVILRDIEALRIELSGLLQADYEYGIRKANIEIKLKSKAILLKKHLDFQVFSAHTLYEDLERFGIWQMPADDKRGLFADLQKANPKATKPELVIMAKSKAYNVFIGLVAKGELVLYGEAK